MSIGGKAWDIMGYLFIFGPWLNSFVLVRYICIYTYILTHDIHSHI